MLKISYKPSTDSKEMKKEYETVNDFLQGQYLEVPPLQDHFVVTTVTLDGKEIEMPDQTSLYEHVEIRNKNKVTADLFLYKKTHKTKKLSKNPGATERICNGKLNAVSLFFSKKY
ncbi:hypothetical protein EfmJHP10_14720 [Enterococcus faecium]|nr:hypothetical protein EfmJHP10_14720 [Enterococcus faecium]